MKKIGNLKICQLIKEHISNNAKEYLIVALMFIIGIFAGVFFVNNIQEEQKTEITQYLNNFIQQFKNTQNLDTINLLKTSITQNVVLAILIWFFGTTVIGIPVVFGIVIYRGFCLGYTVSVTITVLGLSKGLTFSLVSMLLQNIIMVPKTYNIFAINACSISDIISYRSIYIN